MKYKKLTLENGLRVILAPMTETGTATVLVMTGVGSRFETRKENGIAHFLEHMMFKGTEKRPTALDISRELDSIGAEYNAFTSKEWTGYYAKVEAHHWETALDVVSDMFLNAKLDQDEIDRERGTIIQEINMYEDMPMRKVAELWEAHLYGDTPLGWDIAGPKENIRAFKRKDFVKYMERGYVGGNVVVGIAGNIDPKKVTAEVKKRFGVVKPGVRPEFRKASDRQSAPGVFIHKKKTDQTHFLLGVRGYDMYHPDRFALGILSVILGGGMSSRLFIEVRERRGLAYRVRTETEAFHDAGYIATQCGVEHENLEKAIAVILDEYKKIATERVGKDELRKAKEYIKGGLAMGLEGSDEVVEYLVSQEILKSEIVLPKDKVRAIEKVTADDVLRVAQDIFRNDRLNLAIVGPQDAKKKAKLEKMLDLGIQK
ncbi:MAG TPA: pitrilysin family protein [Candidatus Fimivivens sp.]|nr:pitrilysin family protein [Candidatus Fimivivens sp.]